MILSISLATGPIRPAMMLMIRYPFAERSQRSRYLPPLFGDSGVADPVRQPAVKEGFLAGAALGERDVAFALQRLHRAQQHGLAARVAHAQEGVERGEGARADDAVDGDVGIVARGAVERRSEEHTSELQSLMRISYAVFCL